MGITSRIRKKLGNFKENGLVLSLISVTYCKDCLNIAKGFLDSVISLAPIHLKPILFGGSKFIVCLPAECLLAFVTERVREHTTEREREGIHSFVSKHLWAEVRRIKYGP
jgi:hypothetical protein